MRYLIPVIIIIFCFCHSSYSQPFTDSNLPIVIIKTDNGLEIPDAPRIKATLKIIYRGPGLRNLVSDQDNEAYLNYNGRIAIETRGSSSQTHPKKQYGFSTKMADDISDYNVSILGLPPDNDWILNGLVYEPALIRDYLCYNLARMMGEYASRTVYCEVILNGSYHGLYLLEEKIKPEKNRVDILKIRPDDNKSPELTGGYLTKADKTNAEDPAAWTMPSYLGWDVTFVHSWPKPDSVTTEQNYYIRHEFEKLKETTAANDYSFTTGYPSVIDIPSFVNYMIISEFSANADAYQYSTYFCKDRNGKLRAGPIWDNNLTFGNDLFFWGYDRSHTDTWQFSNGDNEGPTFIRDLFNSSKFRCYLSKRWNELTQPGQPLNYASVNALIDSAVATISEALPRENSTWETAPDFENEIAKIKTFVTDRTAWMTFNLGSYTECSNIETPPLVITKIMYHPNTTYDFPQYKDLEFIEITNAGNDIVDLSGIYFSSPGFVYQFPPNTYVAPARTLILASNEAVFKAKYGFSPGGQFTRHLSETGQKFVLADGFGNVIDSVRYSNLPPWPDADGNGSYLSLTDPLSDNSVAANWTATGTSIVPAENKEWLTVYPTLVRDLLVIEAKGIINTLELFNIQGKLIRSVNVNSESYFIDMRTYARGMYFIRVHSSEGKFVRKIVKE